MTVEVFHLKVFVNTANNICIEQFWDGPTECIVLTSGQVNWLVAALRSCSKEIKEDLESQDE